MYKRHSIFLKVTIEYFLAVLKFVRLILRWGEVLVAKGFQHARTGVQRGECGIYWLKHSACISVFFMMCKMSSCLCFAKICKMM